MLGCTKEIKVPEDLYNDVLKWLEKECVEPSSSLGNITSNTTKSPKEGYLAEPVNTPHSSALLVIENGAVVDCQTETHSKLFQVEQMVPDTLWKIIGYTKRRTSPRSPGGSFLCECQGRNKFNPTMICGKKHLLSYSIVYRSARYSCGCTVRPLPADHWLNRAPKARIPDPKPGFRPPAHDYVGATFGRLLITEYVPGIGYRAVCTGCAREELVERTIGMDYETRLGRAGRKECAGIANGKPGCGFKTK